MTSIPKRLKIEPLIEVIWELRFSSKINSLAEILPGIIYTEFKEQYNNIIKLPHAELPSSVLQRDPNLKYIPIVRLDSSQYTIQIGEHVISLSCRRPYSGWLEFGKQIKALAIKLQDTHLLEPERFSLKYIYIIKTTEIQDLSVLDGKFILAGRDLNNSPFHLRIEFQEDSYIHVVQIASPTEAKLPSGEQFNGVLLDIDTIYSNHSHENYWPEFQNKLDKVHDAGKRLFFELLNDNTINLLEPEY